MGIKNGSNKDECKRVIILLDWIIPKMNKYLNVSNQIAATHIRYLLSSADLVFTPFFFFSIFLIGYFMMLFSVHFIWLFLLLTNCWRLMGQFFSNYTEMSSTMPWLCFIFQYMGALHAIFFPWVSNILNLNKDIIQHWVRLLTPMNFFLIFQCIVQTEHQYIIQANQMRSKSQRG